MGLFGSKKKVYVSSVCYNLAGDAEPEDFVKMSIIGGVLGEAPYLGEKINYDLVNGPAARFRNFMRWAKSSGYNNNVGLATSKYYPDVPIDRELLSKIIQRDYDIDFNESFNIVYSKVTFYDYVEYAKIWIINNKSDKINDPFEVEEFSVVVREWREWEEYKDENGDTHYHWVTKREYRSDIRITFSDGSVSEISTENVNKDVSFLYVYYTITKHHLIGDDEVKHYGLVYAHKSGKPELDDFFIPPDALEKTYTPYIPIRLWNKFISTSNMPDTYKFAKKAFKRATGNPKFDDLIKNINDNESIGDIDFTYVVFGVSLNTKQQEGKRYIFNLFKNFWENQRLADRISSPEQENKYIRGLFSRFNYEKQVNIKSNYGSINYDIWLEWASLAHYYGTGLAKPGLKAGEYYFDAYEQKYTVSTTGSFDDNDTKTETKEYTRLYHQITEGQYEVISITDLAHANFIYKGKAVIISGKDALDDKDHSGFIVPMQENTFKEIGLRYATNLITYGNYLVFNCYVVKKQRWYQSGIFQMIAVIIIVVITVVFQQWYAAGATGAAAGGGSAAAAGAAGGAAAGATAGITASSLAAAIGVAVAKAIAVMIVVQIIQKAIFAVFGDNIFSRVLSTVLSLIAAYYIGGIGTGQTFSMSTVYSELMSATGLLKLTAAVGNAVAEYYQDAAQKMGLKTQAMMQEYEEKSDEINQAFKELGSVDSMLMNTINNALYTVYESPDTFLTRTLMTGSDIAERSMNMISEMPELTLSTELN